MITHSTQICLQCANFQLNKAASRFHAAAVRRLHNYVYTNTSAESRFTTDADSLRCLHSETADEKILNGDGDEGHVCNLKRAVSLQRVVSLLRKWKTGCSGFTSAALGTGALSSPLSLVTTLLSLAVSVHDGRAFGSGTHWGQTGVYSFILHWNSLHS